MGQEPAPDANGSEKAAELARRSLRALAILLSTYRDRLMPSLPEDGWELKIEHTPSENKPLLVTWLRTPTGLDREVFRRKASFAAIVFWTIMLDELHRKDPTKPLPTLADLKPVSYELLSCWPDEGRELMRLCHEIIVAEPTSKEELPGK
jgi:hypothetical protein